MSKLELQFTLSYEDKSGKSTAHGTLDLENFNEQAQEIKRWIDGKNASCIVSEVKYVDSVCDEIGTHLVNDSLCDRCGMTLA